jgi:ankyrin repeat protein
MDSSSNPSSTTIFAEQLLAALREGGNLANLCEREIPSHLHDKEDAKEQQGAPFTDDDILQALCVIGDPTVRRQIEDHSILDVCTLLYDRLSESGKQEIPLANKCPSKYCPLHSAAFCGCLDIVTWLVLEKGYNVNQESAEWGRTALLSAADPWGANQLEISRLLLQHGAHPNPVAYNGDTPMDLAVNRKNTGLVRLLVEEYHVSPPSQGSVYLAIRYFEEEILSILLEHGGSVEYPHVDYCGMTSIFRRRHRNSLRNVCRVLVNHSKKNIDDTAAFLLASIVDECVPDLQQSCGDYIDAGVDKHLALREAVQENKESICHCLVELGADPFGVTCSNSTNSSPCCWSPFQVAARLEDMSILRYFMGLWNVPSNAGGKDSHGGSPIHVLCRFQHVSIQAIQLLVQEFEANVSKATVAAAAAAAGGAVEYAHLPFHLAVMSDANLDVVFYLLRLHPDALTDKTTTSTTSC